VGQSAWEEINDGIEGSNYGWLTCEGSCSNGAFRNPLHQYSHSSGCAITGGAFYNPAIVQFPSSYLGSYFFADYCGGWIKRFNPATGAVSNFADSVDSPVDLSVSPDGSPYYLSIFAGTLRRIDYKRGKHH
jgi:glucose/arabinose dehydrogenase